MQIITLKQPERNTGNQLDKIPARLGLKPKCPALCMSADIQSMEEDASWACPDDRRSIRCYGCCIAAMQILLPASTRSHTNNNQMKGNRMEAKRA
jgi:hypothetical protein